MAGRLWRTLDKFDLQAIGHEVLEVESGTSLEWAQEVNGPQIDIYIEYEESDGVQREYVCSMNYGGWIEELKPDYADYFT